MSIHKIFQVISPLFRRRRFAAFTARIAPAKTDRILDIGGYPGTWTPNPPCGRSIDILNIHPIDCSSVPSSHGITTVVGNALALPYPDKSFDVVFSNSVIEHVGTWENQLQFAKEANRVGRKLWIQTPAREFFIEPHYIAPFVHWLPKAVQRRVLRYFTIWGWIEKPSPEKIAETVEEIRLLTYSEMRQLFPDCAIYKERFLGIFTKSYTAFRENCP